MATRIPVFTHWKASAPASSKKDASVKEVLGGLTKGAFKAGAKVSGKMTAETLNDVSGTSFSLKVRNHDRNVVQRIIDRLTGAHITRRKAAGLAIEQLLKQFENQPGAQEIVGDLRRAARHSGKTVKAETLKDGLQKLVDRFSLDSKQNQGLKKAFSEWDAETIKDFTKFTGIPKAGFKAMQAHILRRSALLDGTAVGKPPSLDAVADFAKRFNEFVKTNAEAMTFLEFQAINAEVETLAHSRPDLMDLRPGLVHTPALVNDTNFRTAAITLGGAVEADPALSAACAKIFAGLILTELQDRKNAGRNLPLVFAGSQGIEFKLEMSKALMGALADHGPKAASGAGQLEIPLGDLFKRLESFSEAVYREVVNGLPDHCKGNDVVEVAQPGQKTKTWKREAQLGTGGTAKVFSCTNGKNSLVVKEMESFEARFQDDRNDHDDDIKEARIHQHINAKAPHVAPQLLAVVQSEQGNVQFVMEHAIYGDLDSFIGNIPANTDRNVRNAAVLSLCKQVAECLYELHADANVAQLDFKSEDVLLTRGANGAVLAQLADFGHAREGKTMYVRDDKVHGKERKSPERLVNKGAPGALDAPQFATHAADVWAFGVMMYQMFADKRQLPFGESQQPAVMSAIRKYAVEYSSTKPPGANLAFDSSVPAVAKEFILWIPNPDPEKRPTMAEVLTHEFMKSANVLSKAAQDLIQTTAGADDIEPPVIADSPGRKTGRVVPPDGEDDDSDSSSGDAAPPLLRQPVELKRFTGMNTTEVAIFSRQTGITEKRIAAMQGYLKHLAELRNTGTAGKPRSLRSVAGFAKAFERWITRAPQALAHPDVQALHAEVKAFAVAYPELMQPEVVAGE